MFDQSAEFYDRIYQYKDYAAEAAALQMLIQTQAAEAHTLLDIGCGTGEHHRYLKAQYAVDGIDLNGRFLQIAQGKNREGRYWEADMIDFDLTEQWDVIISLFSSIGYAETKPRLKSALASMFRHLKPGGVAFVEPWLTPDKFTEGHVGMSVVDEEQLKLVRMNDSRLENGVSVIHFEYLIGRSGSRLEHAVEEHRLGLYRVEDMREAFEAAGFEAQFDQAVGAHDRGCWIARRPA